MRFVLASASPRRREILTKLGFDFSVRASHALETDVEGSITTIVKTLAERKAISVSEQETHALIIAADTLVGLDQEILGKPRGEEDAFRMLRLLSGKTHEVSTGLCLFNTDTQKKLTASETTYVEFYDLSDEDIMQYISTGEPMDKAGSYAIQGGAARFVKKYTGSYDNIVGFPTELFLRLLSEVQ